MVATAVFVTGTSIERNAGESAHDDAAGEAALISEPEATDERHSETGEDSHARETSGRAEAPGEQSERAEWRPLGVDIEAWPFVGLAAVVSLGLGVAAWLRPRQVALLAVVAGAMLAFAALDVREVVHQIDEDDAGLAVLAASIALLHAGAAGVAALMAARAGADRPPGAAATLPA